MRKSIISGSLALTLLLSSCATIVSGSKQTINFTSSPSTATIFIDQVEVGKTPLEVKLKRSSSHNVMIKLEGYQTYNTKLSRKFNAWYIGNILFGGIIGIIVDPITGAMYKLSPDEINSQMNKGIAFKNNSQDVFVAVALNIDPSWKKIGQLEKVNN